MPRVCDHLVKSLIRLVRQSTTVPNTSNTRAFTAEMSDIGYSPFSSFGHFSSCCHSGARASANPESRDSGFGSSSRPGMTVAMIVLHASRSDVCRADHALQHLAILDEAEIFRDLIIERAGLGVGRVRQPVNAARACQLSPLIDRFDQRPASAESARVLRDEQILQIAI